jgi:hypothetical protein
MMTSSHSSVAKLFSPTCSDNSTPNAFIASVEVIFQKPLCLCEKVPVPLEPLVMKPQEDDD